MFYVLYFSSSLFTYKPQQTSALFFFLNSSYAPTVAPHIYYHLNTALNSTSTTFSYNSNNTY